MGWSCSRCEGENNFVQDFCVEQLKGQRTLGRTSGRWRDNIKIDFKELGP